MLESLEEQVEQTVSETQKWMHMLFIRPPKLFGFPQISGPTQPMENREQ